MCAGIEAASVAWQPLGWHPAWFSEIDPHACSVLEARHPDTPNLGDMTEINGSDHGPIDLLVGGTPCQSFSVAGLRKGLDDDRGNLAFEFLRIAREARPRWVVWENVPGVLSIDGGRAFGAFLGGLAELGYGWSYRILDAQFCRIQSHPRAVPQRRRRVFVVGCLGDWRRAAAVLFEREGLHGHPPPRREAGASVAALTANGVGTCGADDNQGQAGHLIPFDTTQITSRVNRSHPKPGDPSHPLTGTGDPPAIIAPPLTGNPYGDHAAREDLLVSSVKDVAGTMTAHTRKPGAGGSDLGTDFYCDGGLVAHTLRAEGFDASVDGTGRGTPLVAFSCKDHGADAAHGVAPTLRAMGHDKSHANAGGQVAVAFQSKASASQSMNPAEVAPALDVGKAGGVAVAEGAPATARRLTPRECERLMGFPDDYTAVQHRNLRRTDTCAPTSKTTLLPAKPMADGPRYRLLGNSMAVNVMRWLGERIAIADELAP